jgi:outer membrane protein TolC
VELADAQRALLEAELAELEASLQAWRERIALSRLAGPTREAEGGAAWEKH